MKNRFPQIILTILLLVLLVMAFFLKINIITIFNVSLVKFVMNGIFVLAMIPMINAGVGMNFGLPIGIIAGLLGMCIAVNSSLEGLFGFFVSLFFSIPIGVIFGFIYAKILNKVKGKEDIAAIFVGYSFVPLVNFFWTLAPFTNRAMLYPIGGVGLRPKIGLEPYFAYTLDSLLVAKIGKIEIPLGLLGFYFSICFLIYLLNKSKLGERINAVGENENFACLAGVRIVETRRIAIILSTVIGAIGICVYAQSYGFIELYGAPLNFAFPAVSAILIGGSLGNKATVRDAIIGTYLYQSTYLLSAPVANLILVPQLAEILRMLITNTIILYAFLQKRKSSHV